MSLSTTRSYFKARLDALGYEEWQDGFNFENIPENIIDKAYHIENFEIETVQMDQAHIELDVKVVTRVFFKGFQTIKDALDSVDEKLEAIIVEVMKPTNRLTGSDGLREVQLTSIAKVPVALSNDNTVMAELNWTAQVNICTT